MCIKEKLENWNMPCGALENETMRDNCFERYNASFVQGWIFSTAVNGLKKGICCDPNCLGTMNQREVDISSPGR